MSDTDGTEKRREPNGTILSVEEWIEVLNKHDPLEQYAKRRRERREEETDDE